MNRRFLFSVLTFSFLLVAPVLQGCSTASTGESAESSQDDLNTPCTGPLPDVCERCADGETECAHWVRKDGKCAIQICAPATTTNPNECKTAADCTGPLPEYCVVCTNGGDGCAHHACVDGQCTIATCD